MAHKNNYGLLVISPKFGVKIFYLKQFANQSYYKKIQNGNDKDKLCKKNTNIGLFEF